MLRRFVGDHSGTAAAEMVLVAPLLIILMFGATELGYYFYSEHVVVKAVRDGTRFASREGFEKFTCPGAAVDSGAQADIKHLTRTNELTGGNGRLPAWTSDNSVTVTMTCVDNSSGTYGSIYEGLSGIPVVTVTARVPYTSLFSAVGFNTINLTLTATAQASVTGG